jgi:hypothetical protein
VGIQEGEVGLGVKSPLLFLEKKTEFAMGFDKKN